MIKYNFIVSLLMLLGSSQVYAQQLGTFNSQIGFSSETLTKRNIRNMEFVMYSNGTEPVGNASLKDYYSIEWETVSVISNANIIQKYDKARYNIDTRNLELQIDKKVYFLPVKEIKKLVFTSSNKTFVTKKEEPELGLLEVVAEYKSVAFVAAYDIMKFSQNQTTSSFYENTFDAEKTKKYFLFEDKNKTLFKLSNSKKKNSKFFAEDWNKVAKFIKKEKLSFKKEIDIMKIMEFYTSIKS